MVVPKKGTGEVNHNTQYLAQRKNTDQRWDVYLIEMSKEWSGVQIQDKFTFSVMNQR